MQVPEKPVRLGASHRAKVFTPTIHLLPMDHEGKTYLKLQMRYHKCLYGVLFQTTGVKWSQAYRCFITHFTEEHILKLLQSLKGIARIGLSKKIKLDSLVLQKALWDQQLSEEYKTVSIQLLEYMQLKNYSLNTIRTYYAMIVKFVNTTSLPLDIIHAYGETEINSYHAGLKESGRYSVSYINQSGTRSQLMRYSYTIVIVLVSL
ncbi:hypothetical protein PZB74_18780 [Porifericola rhodea]|uniref:phage integrase N-terminal SAM-like domain-containing protein n=1 Tax=Porifericola rhodea TaxID=930972 RepID=UPI002665A211|nr:phage integrase N-terminal SAM-like domain-containing protein [Porifericola rhodea]WKN30997.1 hypothetical protein PZB74_18780 [Porifericola rhodea]